MRRAWMMAAICVGLVALGTTASARADFDDPLFVYSPSKFPPPPPIPDFEGACGLAVDAVGDFYVSDYYHHLIDVFDSSHDFITRAEDVDPLDGPCGLAVDPVGNLYVNNFHRNVEKLVPSAFPPLPATGFPPAPATSYSSAGVLDSAHPTGVAVDSTTATVYVDARTHVATYDATGAPIPDGAEPLRIGLDSIEDGYGLAVSGFPATSGYLYVPDAGDDTVKVFDPGTNPDNPVDVIDGSDMPAGGFGSLRDSAVAVDDVTGEVYVADTLGTQYSEQPEATIRVFDAAGAYEGQLKHNVIDAAPPGLAVDNSPTVTQGRVYVTSGNSEGSVVYAYPPSAATTPPASASAQAPGGGESFSATARGEASPLGNGPHGAQASSEIAQKGTLRVTVDGRLSPRRLPRRGTAPVSVSVGGTIATTDGSPPPQLHSMRIELNRHGALHDAGLPSCRYDRIQPASSDRALAACRSALVGTGRFSIDVTLSGQEPYATGGRLLVFNGRRGGKPVLYGHIYSKRPFATSFVIVFAIHHARHGAYGTSLTASLPRALGSWGNLTGIEMTLQRRYRYRGASRSYISAGCPAPKGFTAALFPLARTSFAFAGDKRISSVLIGECRVRRYSRGPLPAG